MASTRGDKRQAAISHAIRTTGTLLWCGTGVYSGDGKRSLDPHRIHEVTDETKRFISAHCIRFTRDDRERAASRARAQEMRLRNLAKRAIDTGKYESARKLCDLAASANETWMEYESGDRTMFRIKESQ